jgi:hypothetical protein
MRIAVFVSPHFGDPVARQNVEAANGEVTRAQWCEVVAEDEEGEDEAGRPRPRKAPNSATDITHARLLASREVSYASRSSSWTRFYQARKQPPEKFPGGCHFETKPD